MYVCMYVWGVDGYLVVSVGLSLAPQREGCGQGEEEEEEVVPFSCVLLRGCVVRNTECVVGCVVNTGPDTKIVRSTTLVAPKLSNLER